MANAFKSFKKTAQAEPAIDPLQEDDFDAVDPVVDEADTTGPKSSNIGFINSIFNVGQDTEAIARAAAGFKGQVHIYNPLGTIKEANGKTPIKPQASGVPAPAPAFQQAADKNLPDLTNAYLEKLIGWYREQMGKDPSESSRYLWVKNAAGGFVPSQDESWPAIGRAIRNRERNVETTAPDLRSHIKSMSVPLTREILKSYLDWQEEKTGSFYLRTSVVWVKGEDGSWAIAPFRWKDIYNEFKKPEIRAALGAESLEEFTAQHKTAKLDATFMVPMHPWG